MRSLLLAALAFVACGDASDARLGDADLGGDGAPVQAAPAVLEAAPDTADDPDAAAGPRAEPPPRTTLRCRDDAQAFAATLVDVFDVVEEHTAAFRSHRDPGACLFTIFRDMNATQVPPGEEWPYQYWFVIDENGETRDLEVAVPPGPSGVAAVGFEDVNGDGADDIFVVNMTRDGPAASLSFASDETGWRQLLFNGAEPGPVVRTVAELEDFWRDDLGR